MLVYSNSHAILNAEQTLVTNALELGVIYKLHFKLFCYIFVSNEHQH